MKKYFLIFIGTTLLVITSLFPQQKVHWTSSVLDGSRIDSSYIQCDFINNGIMKLPKNFTNGYNYFTRFYLKDTLCLVNNFTFETRVKNSPSENAFKYYDIYFILYGLNNSRLLCALMGENSGIDYTGIDVNGYYILDSPQLIFDTYNWNVFKFQLKNNVLYFSKNNNLAITLPYQGDFCYITHLFYSFKGNGSVDWVKIYDENDSLYYFEDFIDCYSLITPPTCQIPDNPNIIITHNSPLCEGDTLFLNASSSDTNVKYNWKGPNGFTSKNKSPIIPNINNNMSGEYECSIINETNCTSGKSKCNVFVYPKPIVSISTLDTIPCYGDSALISIDNYNSNFHYNWSTGETSKSIIVRDTGDYYVDVIDGNGCKGRSNTIKINFSNFIPVSISCINPNPCNDDSTLISIDNYNPNHEYYWSTGDSSQTIYAKTSGDYYVDVTDSNGCKGRSNIIRINISYLPNVEIENLPGNILVFDSVNSGYIVSKKIRIKNINPDTLVISNLRLFRNIEFSIPQSQIPIVLLPYESKEITIIFAPIRLGEHFDTLYIIGLCNDIKITLIGICTANTYSGTSKCKIAIRSYTISDSSEFGIYPPNPNPLINSTSIYFELKKPLSNSEYISENNVKCGLINYLGSKFMIDYRVNFIEMNNSIRGEITCNFNSDLPNGFYYLICQVIYKNNVIVESFPIILLK